MAHTNTQTYTPQLETIWARLSSSSSSSSSSAAATARHPCASRTEFDIVCEAFLQAESGVGSGTQEVRRYRAEWNVWAYYFGEQEPFPGIDPALQEQEKEQEHHDDPLARYSFPSNSQSQQPYSSSQSQDRRCSHEYRPEYKKEYEDGEYQDDGAQGRSDSRDDNGTYHRYSEGRDRSDSRQDNDKQHTSEARDDARDFANDKDLNTAASSRDRSAIIHAGGEKQRNSDAARARSDIRDSNNNGDYQKEGYLTRIIRERAERRNRKFVARQPPLGERRRNGEGDGNRDERSLSPRMDDRARDAREDRREDKRDDQRPKVDAHSDVDGATVDGATVVREKEDRGLVATQGAAGEDLIHAARKLQIDFPGRAAAERNARNRAGLKKRQAMEERARKRLRGQDLEERHVGPYPGGRWADRGRDDGDRRYAEKAAEGFERVGRRLVADRYRPRDDEAARDEEGRARGGGGGVWGGADIGAGWRGVDRGPGGGRAGRDRAMDMSEGKWFGGGEIEDLYHNRGRDGGRKRRWSSQKTLS